uniref:EF-hand domain-containing protein n=1 Tax=Pseudo-nitzschia australis TaxID=44445 RepID=A0A7S4AWZ7_9STRA|mmetsp:Transcript_19242/g.41825  ORF Transcript_19242/g.41825 Transcript_19242/m.41825 type:complete len:1116 (-) Transcript_19242:268-3615(-)|eukprot:CAMPEP_0168184708 /NCGR_PEP_ID=MMETSP0139_2-20121125/13392_1 /TAXON_ID=44445 /ORGANISM="Pseudo-nitzschia australis, Strain 10249 10 AB" /LENGTH=1115 /DNA_ID=CAMNT_0008106365 /DNA_START=85 /DNA_END=3432 /DNA_ORIENTATION=+
MSAESQSVATGMMATGNSNKNGAPSNENENEPLSLRSVQHTTPVESYEESLLMDSLEQDDPTGTSSLHLDQAVALPRDFDGELTTTTTPTSHTTSKATSDHGTDPTIKTTNANYDNDKNKNKPFVRPSIARGKNARTLSTIDMNTRTVEENLFELTNSIQILAMPREGTNAAQPPLVDNNNKYNDNSGHQQQQQEQLRRDGMASTQQDIFAVNAGTIFKRMGARNWRPSSTIAGDNTKPGYSGGFFGKHHPETNGAGRVAGSSASQNSNSIYNLQSPTNVFSDKGSDAMDGVRAFRDFLKANRSYALEYCRIAMLVCIIPATTLSFILFYFCGNPGATIIESFKGLDGIDEIINVTSTSEASTPVTAALAKKIKWDGDTASYSWWLLFFVRQTITFSMARLIQFFIVSLAQKAPSTKRCCAKLPTLGPMVRLIILQERGLPMQLQIWGILNFLVLYGQHPHAKNWLYNQDFLEIFRNPARRNPGNPSGGVTYHSVYRNLLLFAIFTGATVGAKRFLVGLRFGKASYQRYAGKLTKVLEEVVEVTKIARFSGHVREQRQPIFWLNDSAIAEGTATINQWMGMESSKQQPKEAPGTSSDGAATAEAASEETSSSNDNVSSRCSSYNDFASYDNIKSVSDANLDKMEQGTHASSNVTPSRPQQHKQQDPIHENLGQQSMTYSQTTKIRDLLGEWEDLSLAESTKVEVPSLSSIVQFRSSCQVLDSPYPFSQAFGYARTRYEVMDCSERVYKNLMEIQKQMENFEHGRTYNEDERSSLSSSSEGDHHPVLKFQTLALTLVGKKHRKTIDQQKLKKLISMFRPARNGDITLLEFCKSIDTVYKGIRKLRASIANDGKMNIASERIINIIFYFIMTWFGVGAIGIDPIALVGLLGSVAISVSFMIGGASSDYFRGLLFILVQRPYDIGDRISVSGIESLASPNGSAGWIVKDVSLYHTAVIYAGTQEYATYSNGAISKSRIINCARSPRAQLNILMKFGINISHTTIEEFRLELKDYIKSKPREWLAFNAFWLTNIEADLGFVEYKILIQHRDSWQNTAGLTTALADVRQFAVNLSKQKGMQYQSPPLPVEMRMVPSTSGGSVADGLAQSLTEQLLGKQVS